MKYCKNICIGRPQADCDIVMPIAGLHPYRYDSLACQDGGVTQLAQDKV